MENQQDLLYRRVVPDYKLEIIAPISKIDLDQIDKTLLTYSLRQIYTGIQQQEPAILLPQIHNISTTLASLIPDNYQLYKYGDIFYVSTAELGTKDDIRDYLYGPAVIMHLLKTCIAPVVFHNGLLDIMMLYQYFIGNLPNTRQEFIPLMNRIFPRIIDTRYNISRRGYIDSTLRDLKYINQIHSRNRTYEESHSYNICAAYIDMVLDGFGVEENVMFSPFCQDIWTWISPKPQDLYTYIVNGKSSSDIDKILKQIPFVPSISKMGTTTYLTWKESISSYEGKLASIGATRV